MDIPRSALDREGVVIPAGAVCSLLSWILARSYFGHGSGPGARLCAVVYRPVKTDEINCCGWDCDDRDHPCFKAFSGSPTRLFISSDCRLDRGSRSRCRRKAPAQLATTSSVG